MVLEAQNPDTTRRGGLFVSLKVLAATLLAIAHTRVELLSLEIEEERLRLSSLLGWTLVVLFCGSLGVVLATLFVMLVLWDTHRLLALGILAALFLLGAALAWLVVRGKIRAKPGLFAASLTELTKDYKELTPRS